MHSAIIKIPSHFNREKVYNNLQMYKDTSINVQIMTYMYMRSFRPLSVHVCYTDIEIKGLRYLILLFFGHSVDKSLGNCL